MPPAPRLLLWCFCPWSGENWTCHAKSGPGNKWTPWSTFGRKKWTGGVHFFLPKVDLPCQKWTWSILSRKKWTRSSFTVKSKQVHFWQGEKVDPVQFPAEIQAGPFLAGEKSGPGPVSLLKSRQVHFVQFRC